MGKEAEQPRWLNGDERRVWLSWLMATRFLWEELERDLQRDAGMAFGYYGKLAGNAGFGYRFFREIAH